ncbi:unnamed protein product [Aphanomyces euteiches]|uniref:Armadillo repeat-containing domain-containing protein n=1 Tax=Aphanomyces euteiches TaxID=100861 RepID=A0A6G0WT31_9STRA|nr:hypothetical protein Ae201684_012005 [Aphanomyces euteiches]
MERNHVIVVGGALVGLVCAGVAVAWLSEKDSTTLKNAEGAADDDVHWEDANVYELLAMLRDRSTPKAVLRLCELAVFKEFQTQIGEMGGIALLIDLLWTSHDDETTYALLITLSNLTIHSTNQTLMHDAEIEVVVATVYDDVSISTTVRSACIRLLCNLAMWDSSTATLLELPVIHTLATDLLESTDESEWSTDILQLFVNLTGNLSAIKNVQDGALESILESTTSFCLDNRLTPRQADNSKLILQHLSKHDPCQEMVSQATSCLDAFSIQL